MRSADDVFQDMEDDRASREAEVRLIENLSVQSSIPEEQRMLRRTVVLLTYAHLEGFCKFALSAYASSVNAAKLPCAKAVTPLAAITLSRVFGVLRDANKKHPYFASKLPDDTKLHRAAREQEFLDKLQVIMTNVVEIPDDAINTESNLSPIVLKRNMYQMGLDYLQVDDHAGSMHRLLRDRNSIAHGDRIKEPSAADVKEYTMAAFAVMKFVQVEVFDALSNKAFERPAAA